MVALIIEQKTTMKQKDKNRKSALDIARKRNNSNGSHDSIIQLIKAAGAEDEAANDAADDRGKPQPLYNLPNRPRPLLMHRKSTDLYMRKLGAVIPGFSTRSGTRYAEVEIDL